MARRLVLHLAAALLSAALWWLATRIHFVPVAIVLGQAAGAWFAPEARSRWEVARLIAGAMLVGGTWAAVGLLAFGNCGQS
jgi:hypothetical protein